MNTFGETWNWLVKRLDKGQIMTPDPRSNEVVDLLWKPNSDNEGVTLCAKMNYGSVRPIEVPHTPKSYQIFTLE